MQKVLNKMLWTLAVLYGVLCIPASGHAQTSEEPIIVLKSSIYENVGESNSFTLLIGGKEDGYIDVDCGWGTEEHEITQATYDATSGSWDGTMITCNVSKEGVVKIYGDASNIDVFNASGCYITELQMPQLTNLSFLDLSHNELQALDLTNFSNLLSLDISDNSFKTNSLKIGGNKPYLTILDVGRMENFDPDFNLSDYPNIVTFDAWANTGLTKLNPTGCTQLQKLSIDGTNVKELDVTQNTRLTILNISDTGIKSIDLSKNTYLQQLYCDHQSGSINTDVKLTSLDVTNNPNLVYLFASGNNLTEIDVTKNTYLQNLYLNNNKLTSINLDNNSQLINVEIRNNNFTFATLPLPDANWISYSYKQNTMDVTRSQLEGTVLDFSDKVLREGTTTTAALYSVNKTNPGVATALGEEYYTYENGKITLLKEISDSVYVAFANDAFPESEFTFYPLCTNNFMIKNATNYGQDDKTITFNTTAGTQISLGIGIYGATAENPKKFYIDYGNGEKVAYTTSSSSAPETPNASGTATSEDIAIYVPENEQITAFDMENIQLNSIDFTQAPSLRSLRLVNAGLNEIDLSWNNLLTKLELTGNHFQTLNIRGANDAYQKNLLSDINLSNNEIQDLTLNDRYSIQHLNLSNNNLTELSLKDADNMITLDVSGNQLTTVDINYCTKMTSLNVANNKVTSIVFPTEISLTTLNCENNDLTFATLPVIAGLSTYTYAPQNEVKIPTIGPGADLSVVANDNGQTTYVWKKSADNSTLVKGTDYNEENGITNFLEPIIGNKVYCEITNSAFNELTLKTSSIEAASMPTNVIATFTTTGAQTGTMVLSVKEDNTPIYIDWKGYGTEVKEYIVGTSPTTFTVESYEGANAKVYSYSEDDELTMFSIDNIPMSSIDASKLTQLTCFSVTSAGLSELKMPESPGITELILSGNNLSEIDLSKYTKLYYLSLSDNKFTTFNIDEAKYPELEHFYISSNLLTSITLNSQKLWSISLASNSLTEIDLSGVPETYQLSLAGNRLSHIDVSGLSKLKVLNLDRNKFKFSTLPLNNNYSTYTYTNQDPLEVNAVNGVVDLSSEAVINNTETVYRWFIDVPTYNDYGELEGEELYIDDEYKLENGVTTFLKPFDNVMCVLTNEQFPDALLYTPLMNIITTGISNVTSEENDRSIVIDGNSIRINASEDTAVRLYGINGALVSSTVIRNGECVIPNVTAGAYVITIGKSAYKVVVK